MANIIHNKNLILENLIKNQRHAEIKNKLNLTDINRIVNNISSTIFSDECCLWEGPIITTNNKDYISFFINNKKISLHRILYNNYIDELNNNEYLKYSCSNKGKCCCLKHFYKVNKKIKIQNEKEEISLKKKEIKSNIVSF